MGTSDLNYLLTVLGVVLAAVALPAHAAVPVLMLVIGVLLGLRLQTHGR
jgi:hypothetical protein